MCVCVCVCVSIPVRKWVRFDVCGCVKWQVTVLFPLTVMRENEKKRKRRRERERVDRVSQALNEALFHFFRLTQVVLVLTSTVVFDSFAQT